MTDHADLRHVRTLGEDERPDAPALAQPASDELRTQAQTVLKQEFDRVLEMKLKLSAERMVGGKEKGRASERPNERIRGMIASLEGMSRFALKMGLITPSENRQLFADAMKRGLHDGWGPGA
jgi:hypothetical protein